MSEPRMPRRSSLLRASRLALASLAVVTFVACASVRSRADDAYTKGDYLSAAGLYAQALAEQPNDGVVRARLSDSRERALVGLAAAAEGEVRAGNRAGALEAIDKLVTTRAAWGHEPSAPTRERIARLATWARAAVTDEIVRVRDAEGALAAEAKLKTRATFLAHTEFGTAAQELAALVRTAGEANCAALTAYATPTAPYLSELVAAYCRHFQAPAPAVPPLPDLISRLTLDAAVEGLEEAQRTALDNALDAALRDSVWFAAEPPRAGSVRVTGELRSTFASTAVTRQADWVESVPYVTTETYQEEYRESYLDTEYYTEQVPYSDTETYSTTCGFGSDSHTCMQTRTVTRYRSEQRSRMVTRWRTAYRPATRMVTRYRDEPRVFTYSAIERSGTYRSDWTARVAFGAATPFDVHRTGGYRRTGDDHDADFEPAGVHPSRASLPTHAAWVSSQVNDLARAFASAADAHWARLYCQRDTYSIEEAARCVYLRAPSYPVAARAPLTKLFGRELERLLAAEP